jgi:hypothetical protein
MYISGPCLLILFNGIFWLMVSFGFWLNGSVVGGISLAIASFFCWLCNAFTYLQLGGSGKDLILLPISDVKLIFVMIWSYCSNEIIWRGQRYCITKYTKILSPQ